MSATTSRNRPAFRARTAQAIATIHAYVQTWITEHGSLHGTRLPSERALATATGEGLHSIRVALDLLVEQGVLERPTSKSVIVGRLTPRSDHPHLGAVAVISTVLADREPTAFPSGRLASALRQAIERHQGSTLLLNPALEADTLLNTIRRHRPDGVVITCGGRRFPHGAETLRRLQQTKIPIVVSGDEWSDASVQHLTVDHLVTDHSGGTQELVAALVGQGCQEVHRMALPDRPDRWVSARTAGYRRGMLLVGQPEHPPLPMPDGVQDLPGGRLPSREVLHDLARQCAPTLAPIFRSDGIRRGLLAATDGHLFILQAALRLIGREPGQDVLLAGYDHYLEACELERQWEPPVAHWTVDKDERRQADHLVDLLLRRRADDGHAPLAQHLIPHRLVTLRA